MMKNWKRAISFLLCAAMLLGNFPVVSFAAENDGLCEHHTVHESCGYEEGVSDCGYHCHDCEMANQPPVTEETKPVCTRLADCAAENHEADCEKAAAEKAAADQAAADAVAALIAALPALADVQAKPLEEAGPEYTQVNAAYDAYQALTEEQKTLLSEGEDFFMPYLMYFSGQTQEVAIYSGICGTNLEWSLNTATGLLKITGSGAMDDYDEDDAPWFDNVDKITSVELPDGLTTIGYCAFRNAALTSVTVPDSVTKIKDSAFLHCENLTDVDLGDGCSIYTDAFAFCPIKNLQLGNSSSFGVGAFTSSYLTSITIAANGVTIGDAAFWDCSSLAEVHFTGSAPSAVRDKGVVTGSSTASFRDVTWYYDCSQSGWTTSSRYDATAKTWAGYTLVSEHHAFGADGICTGCGERDPEAHTHGEKNYTLWTSATALPEEAGNYCLTEDIVLAASWTVPAGETKLCLNGHNVSGEYKTGTVGNGSKLTLEDCAETKGVIDYLPITVQSGGVLDVDGANLLLKSRQYLYVSSSVGVAAISNEGGTVNVRSGSVSVYVDALAVYGVYGYCIDNTSGTANVSGGNLYAYAKPHGDKAYEAVCIFNNGTANITGGTFKAETGTNSGPTAKAYTIANGVSNTARTNLGGMPAIDGAIRIPGANTLSAKVGSSAYFGGTLNLVYDNHYTLNNFDIVVRDVDATNKMKFKLSHKTGTTMQLTYIGNHLVYDKGEVHEHSWTAADCDATRYCSVCEFSDGETWGHDWSAWDVTDAATCQKEGKQIRSCQREDCDATDPQTIPISDHAYNSNHVCVGCGVVGGTCGENLEWTLADGVMTISGEGDMTNYTSSQLAPWSGLANSITSIVVESGVTSIGNRAFRDLNKVTNVSLPDTIKVIGAGSFSGMQSLLSIQLPSKIEEIKDGTFQNCSSLTHVEILYGVETIGSDAFAYCSAMTSIVIPNSVKTIKEYAFSGCTALEDVIYGDTKAYWQEISIEMGNEPLLNATLHCSPTNLKKGTCGDNLRWTLYGDLLLITGTGPMTNYARRDDYSTAPWTQYGDQIKKVVISAGATSVGDYAFRNVEALEKVVIANTVTTIGNNAFMSSKNLASVQISNGVSNIGEGAFADCTKLTSLDLPDSVTSIGQAAFMGCVGLVSMEIPNQVTVLNDKTFYGCSKLQSITLPTALTAIGEYAFEKCSALNNITIPSTVSTIGKYAFSGCAALTSIEIPSGVTQIADFTFSSCSKLTNVTIPNTVTSIGGAAFTGCGSLHAISIPNSVTQIGDGAFSDCYNLESIALPSGVTGIGIGTFAGCDAMERIDIPGGVTTIGDEAFKDCGSLADVYFGGTSEMWSAVTIGTGNTALENAKIHFPDPCADGHNFVSGICSGCNLAGGYCGDLLENLGQNMQWTWDETTKTLTIIGSGKMEDYARQDAPWHSLKGDVQYVVIGSGITRIGGNAFGDCVNLVDIDLPDSLQQIGILAFNGCKALQSIHLPAGLTTIETGVFENSGLTGIEIPSGVTCIDQGTFAYCRSLKTVVIPESVKEILKGAFFDCNALESLTLKEGLEIIGYEVFYNCDELTSVAIPVSVKEIDAFAFQDCDKLASVTIPKNVSLIGEMAFGECDQLTGIWVDEANSNYSSDNTGVLFDKNKTKLLQMPSGIVGNYTVPNSVTTIERMSFWGCKLSGVVVSDGVTTIAAESFANSDNLRYVVLPATLTDIGIYAFDDNNHLWHILYTGTEAQWDAISVGNENDPIHFTTRHYLATGNEIIAVNREICDQRELFKCTICDAVCTETIVDGEHSWATVADSKYLVSAATCQVAAVYKKSCAVCGVEGTETFKHGELDSSNHTGNNHTVNAKTATCTEEGYTGDEVCECGATVKTGEVIEKAKHSYNEKQGSLLTAGTCINEAVYAVKCDNCTAETDEKTVKGAKNSANHMAGTEIRDAKAATCTVDGYTGDTWCLGCQTKIADGETIGAPGHSHTAVVTPPTCTAEGYTTYTCHCGDIYTGNRKDRLSHDLDVWITVKDVTCTENGSKRRDCSYCDYFETAAIYADGHNHELTEIVYPTCTETGYTTYVCTKCGDSYKEFAVGPDGHKYEAVITPPTCVDNGYTTHTCSVCGDVQVDSYTDAMGHDLGEWTIVTEPAPGANGEERRDCGYCDYFETRATQYQGNILKLEGEDLLSQSVVYINGLPYPVKGEGDNRYVELPTEEDCYMVTYTYHVGDAADVHTQYPTGMKAYRIKDGKIEYIPELDNVLQYSGASIRITGTKGIRMITSLTKDNKSALTGNGLAGYTLVEYGTALCWASEIKDGDALVLGREFTRSNYAYKKGVADPVFATSGNLTQYTNVLVGFSLDQCKDDIAMRPYIILEDAEGEQVTLYGGTIYRSIGYIAYQNRSVFQPKTASYNYVWEIIHHVYGDKYDADYKG